MICKIFLCFLFACSKVTIFVNHKENNVCDGYVGFSKEIDDYDEVKIFLSNEINILFKKIDNKQYIADIVTLVNESSLPLLPINSEEYEELRSLGSNIQDSELRDHFNDSVKYFKCSFNCNDYRHCVLEYILYKEETNTVSWAHSIILYLEEDFIYGNAYWQRKCDLKINVSRLDTIIGYLNNKCQLESPNILSEIRNERMRGKILSRNRLKKSSANGSWENMTPVLGTDPSNENRQNILEREINDHDNNITVLKKSNINTKTEDDDENDPYAKYIVHCGLNNKTSYKRPINSLKYYDYAIFFIPAAISLGIFFYNNK
ncbi:putative SP-containing membrane protein [Vairimorpha necatrix]|uniref:SP-containing membrane protein n=1 Tax=Vairimorpha necatrix TaxID=6039 RepID=A0AAX4J9X3_9MICR